MRVHGCMRVCKWSECAYVCVCVSECACAYVCVCVSECACAWADACEQVSLREGDECVCQTVRVSD